MNIESIHFAATPQHILVTGGSGFIGQLLVKALIADGHIVTVLTRDTRKVERLFAHQVNALASMEQLPSDTPVNAIINLAGARILGKRWTEKQKANLWRSRISLTDKGVQWIAKATNPPQILISASAIGYYGIQSQGDNKLLTEEHLSQDIFMSNLCQDWESAAQKATQYGVSVARMRFGLVLGKGGALPMMLLPIRLGMGGRTGTGKQWLSWIHVEDLLRGIAHIWQYQLANNIKNQAYNFTAPEALLQADFIKTAANVLHRPTWMPTPAWVMRLLLGEQADILLEGQRVYPQVLLQTGFEFNYPLLKQALKQLEAQ